MNARLTSPARRDAIADMLKAAGLRPTAQRLSLARLLFNGPDRHISADELFEDAQKSGIAVSLATIYNTLNQFSTAGLLREVVVESGKSYFDTNTEDHHHFYLEDESRLVDIPGEQIQLARLPETPQGHGVSRVDVIVRLTKKSAR